MRQTVASDAAGDSNRSARCCSIGWRVDRGSVILYLFHFFHLASISLGLSLRIPLVGRAVDFGGLGFLLCVPLIGRVVHLGGRLLYLPVLLIVF